MYGFGFVHKGVRRMNEMEQLKPGGDTRILRTSESSVARAAVTVYESAAEAALALSGIQRSKHLGAAAKDFKAMTNGIAIIVGDLMHPLLWDVVKSNVT